MKAPEECSQHRATQVEKNPEHHPVHDSIFSFNPYRGVPTITPHDNA